MITGNNDNYELLLIIIMMIIVVELVAAPVAAGDQLADGVTHRPHHDAVVT